LQHPVVLVCVVRFHNIESWQVAIAAKAKIRHDICIQSASPERKEKQLWIHVKILQTQTSKYVM